MKYTQKKFETHDFLRIRDFLKHSLKSSPDLKNWFIDRWNFCRYWGQIMHNKFEMWPETVGIWEDEHKEIVAVVHPEGEGDTGEAHFQLADLDFSNEFLNELIDYAEMKLALHNEGVTTIDLIVNEDGEQLKELLKKRSYILQNGKETTSYMNVPHDVKVELPKGFRISDANEVGDFEKGFAHGRAFGYFKGDYPDHNVAERCYISLRNAPDYIPELDVVILDQNNEVASFTTLWYDELNKIGILEPVGTIPKYRKMGLGKAVIYEAIKRVKDKGVERIFVGSDQPFYLSIGFSLAYSKEVWQKRTSLFNAD
ncbi:GNAT family N-acetyltransferase [Paenibacillus sp. DRB1-1]|uniref:GNAT family N-acetyltransferase n=1 Tax=Paenibacillus sp. DRB1-1 TaxID=3422309 RepID=UPI003F978F07